MKPPFTLDELEKAILDWGCNCGPAAFAFATQLPLDFGRHALTLFSERQYTTPTMMLAALAMAKRKIVELPSRTPDTWLAHCPDPRTRAHVMAQNGLALVFIQFTGRWPNDSRWAYCHTHWVATYLVERDGLPVPMIYDINGGCQSIAEWVGTTLPALTNRKRRDGGWYPRKVWCLPKA